LSSSPDMLGGKPRLALRRLVVISMRP
jgi:hypothetical protein